MKRSAFTMMELVFVIVIAGIISAVIIPRMDRDTLSEATLQVASHIRYAQHLAMVDDKFIPDPSFSKELGASATLNATDWYKGRWQIFFSKTANGTISYSVISDSTKSNYDGNPNANFSSPYTEVAVDPMNSNLYLIGTTYSSFDGDDDEHINKKLDLKNTYGVEDIRISGGSTGSGASRIIFDHLGRPYRGATSTLTGPHDRLASSEITIKLCSETCNTPYDKITSDNERLITITPETGFIKVDFSS